MGGGTLKELLPVPSLLSEGKCSFFLNFVVFFVSSQKEKQGVQGFLILLVKYILLGTRAGEENISHVNLELIKE